MTEEGRIRAPSENARVIAAQVSELANRVEDYETLIVHEALRKIEGRTAVVLARLAQVPAISELSNDSWPYSTPLPEAGFIDQLAWAKHESDFPYWQQEFQKPVRRACRGVVEDPDWHARDVFDLLISAASIEIGPSGVDEMLEWSARRLSDHVWSQLMMSDSSILDDFGLRSRNVARDERDMAYLVECHAAVLAWSDPQFDAIARRVIHTLQRRDAVGAFDADHSFESLWDEYCHLVQEGLHRPDWHATVGSVCLEIIAACDPRTLRLLTVAAIEVEGKEWSAPDVEGPWPMLVADVVIQRLRGMANERKLARYRRWQEET